MSATCIFCRIVSGELPAKKIFEDDQVLVFQDIQPVAVVHWLLVPKAHYSSHSEMAEKAPDFELSHLMRVAADVAKTKGLEQTGYRLLTNNGKDAGQVVFHVHWHLLAGERLGPLNGN